MPRLTHVTPAYRRHATGQAIVVLSGQTHYLGAHGTPESRAKYDRLVAEWLANGRHGIDRPLTVAGLIAAFWTHAQTYYTKDGKPTSEQKNLRDCVRVLKRLHADTPASEFGPLSLKAVRDEMIRLGWVRTSINRHLSRLKLVFRWAAGEELIGGEVLHALNAVGGLKAGRSEAKESAPVQPVADALVDAVRPFVSRQVWAMVQLQRLTGMRSGEVCRMRGMDLDRAGEVWSYTPGSHKTQHHGHARIIHLGKQAQAVIGPFLRADPAEYLFRPVDAENARHAARTAARRTPLSCGSTAGNRKARPQKQPGQRYTPESYCRAIHAACGKAEVERWHPHQLRHTVATELRKRYGLEVAQVMLGHATLTAAQIYAERNMELARSVAKEWG